MSPQGITKAMSRVALTALGVGSLLFGSASAVYANPEVWKFEWPNTDFEKTNIDYGDILSGGPPKDGIPAIDNPVFGSIADGNEFVEDNEPVISLEVNGEARAYPLQILMWHEIVNDEIGGMPVAVTYCPLCNSTVVFDRRVGDDVLDFGTTGKLRFSDLVMYDRQTESWWQQFVGEGIVGEHTGTLLDVIPARVEAYSNFKERFPNGQVQLIPQDFRRAYGQNPYTGYDSSSFPFLFRGDAPENIAPLAYVLAVGNEAWSLDLLKQEGTIEKDGIIINWTPGMASALDQRVISQGQDLGNVTVQRRNADGSLEDVAHDMTFAFNFNAFIPDGVIHQ